MTIRATDRNPESWQGDGTVVLGRTRFRGTWMNGANARIRIRQWRAQLRRSSVTRNEGTGSGSFTYDFKKHEVRVSNIRSSLYPADVIVWIDPKTWKTVAPYKFRRPPNVIANGVYQFHGGKNTHLEIKVDGAGGMDYVFLGKTLPFDRVSARLLFTNDRLQISDVRTDVLAGTLRGTADISLARTDPKLPGNAVGERHQFPAPD